LRRLAGRYSPNSPAIDTSANETGHEVVDQFPLEIAVAG
jgi:hypothetical protein